MTRGESLFNPFNLEKNNIRWQGAIYPGADDTFVQFATSIYGLRAGFLNIKSNINEKFDTITKLITKYAPPSENDTATYIKAVSHDTGIDKDAIVQFSNIKALGISIIKHEQGAVNYDIASIEQALNMAGVPI